MLRRNLSTLSALIALYSIFIGIQCILLQKETGYPIFSIAIFFGLITVFSILFIVYYRKIIQDLALLIAYTISVIYHSVFFILGFVFDVFLVENGSWAGEPYMINMLFYTKEFYRVPLLEYSSIYSVVGFFSFIILFVVIGMVVTRSKYDKRNI